MYAAHPKYTVLMMLVPGCDTVTFAKERSFQAVEGPDTAGKGN